MKTWLLGLGVVLCLAFAGCGGDAERGETCNEDDDMNCESSLQCVPLAIGCVEDCEGTCEKACDSNADCKSDEFCTSSRGASYCVDREFSPN